MASCSLCEFCTFGPYLLLRSFSSGTVGGVETWGWWTAAGVAGKAFACQDDSTGL